MAMLGEEEMTNDQDDVPVGVIIAFSKKPNSKLYLKCDGETYYQRDYPELHETIQATYGMDDGDSLVNFKVPDLRGRFIRAVDDGA